MRLQVGTQPRIRDRQIVLDERRGGSHEARIARRRPQVARTRLIRRVGVAARVALVGEQAPAVR